MSTPYWGQLPGPKIVHKNRRMADDERPSSLDAHPNPNSKLNRTSVQTNQTFNTETTFSSLVSPTASSFVPTGLAPRPPSYQRPLLDPEFEAGPPTQASRQPHRDADEADKPPASTAYPNALEAPPGPPLSYRHPYGNGGLPYTHPEPGSDKATQSIGPPAQGKKMDYGEQYTTRHEGPYGGYGDAGAAAPPATVDSSRKASAGTSERRRNLTKEEKRARVEAAERRARERAAHRAGEVPVNQAPTHQPVPSSNRHPPAPNADLRTAPAAAAAPVPREPPVSRAVPVASEPPPEQGPTARHMHPEDRNYRAPAPRARDPAAHVAPPSEPNADLPRRNLSFRERATRDEISFPDEVDRTQQPRQSASNGSSGFSLARSGSNKLKKDPPGERSYNAWAQGEPRASVSREPLPAEAPSRGTLPHRVRDKELPPEPKDARRPTATSGTRGVPLMDDPVQGIQRRATEPIHNRQYSQDVQTFPAHQDRALRDEADMDEPPTPQDAAAQRRKLERQDSDYSSESSHHHRISNMLYKGKEGLEPGDGLYNPPQWLAEWKKAPIGVLAGPLVNMAKEQLPADDKNKAWWEGGGRRSSYSSSARPSKAEAFDGEYDDLHGPTRFKPQLYLECGPLLRYCGIRQEKVTRPRGPATEREMWRGSIMIVTRDSDSSYDIAPMLRLFVQDLERLPPPPHQIKGELSPEYVDPIAGHPKLGRRGETLFVRPVEHLEEGVDLSMDETDDGLFEATRSPPDIPPPDGSADYPGTFASRMKRVDIDGEKLQKYKDVRGFRLHAERGCTFWRFNIEVELRDSEQRIAYRINRGPCNAFWVPARAKPMNIMFHSCNGFSIGAKTDALSGPDPMWRDVLNNHQTTPFHVMVGGGDQIYNDQVADECDMFIDWLEMRNPFHKRNAPFTAELQSQLEDFYFFRYCDWFSQGLSGLANAQIPMVNIWSDRESFNGFGSYPHRDMDSPVLSGVGSVAFKYYMLFQHQSIIPETEQTEPSWILGHEPGPYVNELSRSVYVSLGSKIALLAADCRTERTEDNVIEDKTWEKIMNRLYKEVRRGHVEHLLVVLPVPIAYPRLAWLETILRSKAVNPVKALGKTGLLGKALKNVDGASEVLDELRDHWTAKNHKHERSILIEDLQDLAIDKSLRITILSGEVNMAAVGQFYSNPKLELPKHKDPRYMPNVVSSAIANAPPPDIMADALNKRHKVHHFDEQTEECMIPMFQHGVDGKPRNNKRLLPHRNWCSIRQWVPGSTPPPTPPLPAQDGGMSPPPAPGGLLRRLSLGGGPRPNMSRDSVRGPRPPVSGGGGLFRSLSRSLSRRNSVEGDRPAKLTRTLSLGRGDSEKRGFFGFGRRNSQSRPDDGGIDGQWGPESEEDEYDDYPQPRQTSRPQAMGLRGGAAHDEYSDGDDDYFTAQPPRRAQTMGAPPMARDDDIPPQALKPFVRTPTGLTTKQLRRAEKHEVDLEGGLDICLNVEVNPRDPTGITVPYRLLVPKLFYEYRPETDRIPAPEPSGFKRLLSFRRKEKAPPAPQARAEEDYEEDEQGYGDEMEQRYEHRPQQQFRGQR